MDIGVYGAHTEAAGTAQLRNGGRGDTIDTGDDDGATVNASGQRSEAGDSGRPVGKPDSTALSRSSACARSAGRRAYTG